MNVFDFVTQDEMDDLPEDPREAFLVFVRHAQKRLKDFTQPLLPSEDENDWGEIWNARHSFVNVIVAAARRLHVEPFGSMSVLTYKDFSKDDYLNFVTEIDHYTTQIALDASIRSRSQSTSLPDTSKDKIRSYLHYLREAVREANLTDAKKAALLERIDDFETALEKKRISLLAVTLLTVEILAIPGALWGSYEATTKLLTNILQSVAEAKAVDDEQRKLPPTPEPYALAPPRRAEDKEKAKRGSFSRELDDEIPF